MVGRRLNDTTIKEIKLLRSKGYSLLEISQEVSVPKTTVFYYIKGVEILPEYLSDWAGKRGGSRNRRLSQEKKAFEEATELVRILSDKEKILFLSALYWAEGSKKDFGLSNTDPNLIKVFVEGLRGVFGITDDRLRVSVRIYEDLDRERCLSFWSDVVGIPKEKFINVNVVAGKKKGKLPYGMCRVRVAKGGELLKKINGINKMVVNYLSP